MSGLKTVCSYGEFAKIVKAERRFIFDGKAGDFLAAIRAASQNRTYLVKAGRRLFRAQIDSQFVEDEDGSDYECPSSEVRMNPDPKHIKSSGRANPPGIAYLYLANSKETALAEMRPWLGESLTIALFETVKDLNLVICHVGLAKTADALVKGIPAKNKVEQRVWDAISHAFSSPVNQKDQESDYLPTQILAERFKADGFDGFVYRSGLERGSNVVLFDRDSAKSILRAAYTVKKVRYDFEGIDNWVFSKAGRQIREIHTETP